uniref:Asparagine synthetase [glutamine-hydrolyzing] n=1 Tax=Phlebotomus papatasi TaxID=29031 RepID=A0A1B0DHM8_PHLPP
FVAISWFILQYREHFRDVLHHRGPDCEGFCYAPGIFFASHVLWHQGSRMCSQPIEDDHGILLFNGDLFMDVVKEAESSDTSWLFESLCRCSTSEDVRDLLKTLTGPFCFIFYQKSSKTLFISRDALGRNSLLLGIGEDSLILTSAGGKLSGYNLVEVPPLGLYEIHLNGNIKVTFWDERMSQTSYFLKEEAFLKNLLLSNGISYSSTNDFISPSWLELNPSGCNYSFKEIFAESSKESPEKLLQKAQSSMKSVIERLITLLENSVRDRVASTVTRCKDCLKDKEELPCNHSRVGILFSGGIDCTILAILSDKFIPRESPIDLLNVAFEKSSQGRAIDWNVPDRLSAKEALEELQRICPDRSWNLVEVNVTKEEKVNYLTKEISHLIHPRNTVLDESLGVALWFAARESRSCRVLLIGSGADELFGGYTRHRLAFNRGGEEALKQELADDWARLPSRNLARDDRVICDHGVTQRSPFIEENLVSFLLKLDPLQKCYPPLGPGIGDKTLLRVCGYHLGLTQTAWRTKKALQFGSRVANSQQNANDISEFLS